MSGKFAGAISDTSRHAEGSLGSTEPRSDPEALAATHKAACERTESMHVCFVQGYSATKLLCVVANFCSEPPKKGQTISENNLNRKGERRSCEFSTAESLHVQWKMLQLVTATLLARTKRVLSQWSNITSPAEDRLCTVRASNESRV